MRPFPSGTSQREEEKIALWWNTSDLTSEWMRDASVTMAFRSSVGERMREGPNTVATLSMCILLYSACCV
eukprot:CAMPEP_0177683852 /NCGR_PEP_ID=MMETSP0447-20121125/32072_1 /TAXON_ID=0 /ORGANISM="Stygamoeba regulata, Strain BSH-02190019" /LENGTH=69 /DNA_ID=CAMNT_0019193567 /DNA_START=23 /DNA_END=228 /DNA_ORIENTATION=-